MASFWAASNVPAVVDRVPPERSALTALSASAGSGLKGATTCGSPPDATTMVRTPSGSRSRNSVAPLCTASNASAVMSDAVSITRATDRLRDIMGVTVVVTGLPSTVTDNASGASSGSGCAAATARTIETRGADAVCTAITRGSSGPARARCDTKGTNKSKASMANTTTVAALPRSSRLSSKDHQVVTVMSGGRIERSSAGHQSEFRFSSRVVDELARELGLVISLQRCHQEPGRGPVCAFDQNLVQGLKLTEPEEHRWSRPGVDVAQDDRRSDLSRPGAAGPPARRTWLPGYFDALVGCPPQRLEPGVHVDRGDAETNRGSSLPVRARRAVGGEAGVSCEARLRDRRCRGIGIVGVPAGAEKQHR